MVGHCPDVSCRHKCGSRTPSFLSKISIPSNAAGNCPCFNLFTPGSKKMGMAVMINSKLHNHSPQINVGCRSKTEISHQILDGSVQIFTVPTQRALPKKKKNAGLFNKRAGSTFNALKVTSTRKTLHRPKTYLQPQISCCRVYFLIIMTINWNSYQFSVTPTRLPGSYFTVSLVTVSWIMNSSHPLLASTCEPDPHLSK